MDNLANADALSRLPINKKELISKATVSSVQVKKIENTFRAGLKDRQTRQLPRAPKPGGPRVLTAK